MTGLDNAPLGVVTVIAAVMLLGGCGTTPVEPATQPGSPRAETASVPAATAAVVAATSVPSFAAGSDADMGGLPAGARITATVPIGNTGAIAVAGGAIYVIDRGTPDSDLVVGAPAGALVRIAPDTLGVTTVGRGLVGAGVAVTGHAAWIASAALDSLVRVDLQSGAVTAIGTGRLTAEIVSAELRTLDDADNYPYAVAAKGGSVWVANHHAGSVARFDATTARLVASVPVLEPGGSGPANLSVDGAHVWVTASRSSTVFEIDTARNAVTRTFDVGFPGACGGTAVDDDSIWVASGFDGADDCHTTANWGLTRIDRASGTATRIDVGGRPMDVALGAGAAWVVLDMPLPELVRVDLASNAVVGRLRLPMPPNITRPLAFAAGSVWIRLVPPWDDGQVAASDAVPAVLRIEPTP